MLRLRVLGAIELQDSAGHELTAVLAQPKRLALLTYLAISSQPFHRRDTLLALFWPELDDARGRAALNQALRFLRKESGRPGILVSRGDEDVGVDPAQLWCDARALRDAAMASRHADALELYRGELLQGFFVAQAPEFEEWVERERARLRTLAAQAARAVATAHERDRDFAAAVVSARRALELTDLDERAMRDLLDLLDRLGDRAGAIRAYEEFAAKLREQYGTEPATETIALAQRIRMRRDDRVLDPSPVAPAAARPEMAAAAVVVAPRPWRVRRRRIGLPVGIAAVFGAAWLTVFLLGATRARLYGPHERVIVTDFRVSDMDTRIADVIKFMATTGLSDSPEIRIVPRDEVNAALSRMRRSTATPIDVAVARDLAMREGVRAVIDGYATRVGSTYEIGLHLVSADSGADVAAFHTSVRTVEEVPPAMDRLTGKLRERIGESLRSVRATPPLIRATTSSMEALLLYTAAGRAKSSQARLELDLQAVKADSEFAMAWRAIAYHYANLGFGQAKVESATAKAYRFRSGTSHLDRLRIEEQYARFRGDRMKAGEIMEEIVATIDSVTAVIANMGSDAYTRRDWAACERLGRFVIQRTTSFLAYQELANCLMEEGKFAAADSLLRVGASNGDMGIVPLRTLYHRGAWDAYTRSLDSMSVLPNPTTRRQAATLKRDFALLHGRLRESDRLSADVVLLRNAESAEPSLDDVIGRAQVDLWVRNDPAGAVRELQSAGASQRRLNDDLVVGELYATAGRADLARAVLSRFDRLADTSDRRRWPYLVARVRAGIALTEGRTSEALVEIRRGDNLPDGPVNDCVICLYARLGDAFDRGEMADSAIAMYEAYVATPNASHVVHQRQDRFQLARIFERLGELHQKRGDRQRAIDFYQRFVDLWKDADPELQPRVREARRRLALLEAPPAGRN
jgi:DNA-binding SARP family transcriptional activator